MTDRIRVLIVDDHPIVRDGLRGQLETRSEFDIVAEAGSAEEALAVLGRRTVDVLVTDLRMPGLGGIGLIRAARDQFPDIEIVVLTTYDTDDDVGPAMAAGARGYVLKDAGRESIFAAVRAASRGAAVFSPPIGRHLSTARILEPALLSDRESEVLRLVSGGRSNRQIGTELHIGEATVKTHLQHVFAKLDAVDRAAAVAQAYRRGLL